MTAEELTHKRGNRRVDLFLTVAGVVNGSLRAFHQDWPETAFWVMWTVIFGIISWRITRSRLRFDDDGIVARPALSRSVSVPWSAVASVARSPWWSLNGVDVVTTTGKRTGVLTAAPERHRKLVIRRIEERLAER